MADIVMASQVALLEEAVGLMDAQNKALLGELGRAEQRDGAATTGDASDEVGRRVGG